MTMLTEAFACTLCHSPRATSIRARLLEPDSWFAIAVRHALTRWPALIRYADDSRLDIDNNAAERSLRGIAIGRKNWLFAG